MTILLLQWLVLTICIGTHLIIGCLATFRLVILKRVDLVILEHLVIVGPRTLLVFELLLHFLGVSDDVLLATGIVASEVLQILLIDHLVHVSIDEKVTRQRNIILFEHVVDLAAIPQKFLMLQVVNL